MSINQYFLEKRPMLRHRRDIAATSIQCRDIRFPMLRHYVGKVLTLLQCRNIAATLAEEEKAEICQCRDMIMTLLRHQTNVRTSKFNVATSEATLVVKLYQASNVATSPRHGSDIGYDEKN